MHISTKARTYDYGKAGLIVIILLCVAAVVGALVVRSRFPTTSDVPVAFERQEVFPEIDTANLSEVRRAIIARARQEHSVQPEGTKYSEGVEEPWCADFVSWIMREVGAPLKNPHSGSWRIPGIFTLKEYYESVGRFYPVGSDYAPRPGDVAIYQNSPKFDDHVHIILSAEDDILTTVGGNEHNRVRVYENTEREYRGLIGYGGAE